MPMIRGRYYINPAMGAALERARSLNEENSPDGDHDGPHAGRGDAEYGSDRGEPGRQGRGRSDERDSRGSIHRIEIECAEVGQNGAGRSQRGYVAHLHRTPHLGADHVSARPGQLPTGVFPSRATAHVFTDHNDLADFLREELGNEHQDR
jgi:hypothetical protein